MVDAGNSATKLALVTAGRLDRLGSVRRSAADTGDPVGEAQLGALLAPRGLQLGDLAWIGVSSVVPCVSDALRTLARRRAGNPPVLFVTARSAPLPITYEPVGDLGADRIANAVAARAAWGAPVVVVDVGTALTCDLVGPAGGFAGGAIVPGPLAGYRGLVGAAPLLASVPAPRAGDPVPDIGTSTRSALHVGVLRGAAGVVDGLARGYHRLVGRCPVVATGGMAAAVAAYSDEITGVEVDLTLRGVALVTRPATTGGTRSRRARPGPPPGRGGGRRAGPGPASPGR